MTNLFTFNGLEGQKGTISRVCLGFASVLSRLSLGFLSVKSWRICAILVMLLCLGVGNAWGTETLYETITLLDNGTASDGSSSFNASSSTSGVLTPADSVSFTATTSYVYQAQSGLGWKLSSSGSNGTLTFSLAHTIPKVTKIVVNAKRYHATKGTKLNCNSLGQQTLTTSLADYTFTYGSATNISQIVLAAAAASSGDRRCYITTIKIYYDAPAACSTPPTVGSSLTSVSATVNSITATVPISSIGGCNITENGLVYSTSVATPEVGAANCTKVTVTACGSTAANKTVTISDLPCGTSYYVRGYATNAAGTSYTNVTTQSTSACPLYTVTLMDDSDTRTQASYEASVTLPSRAGCAGYTFAGWTKTWVAPQSSWTTTALTIIPAGSYTPSANENLYPVYTKTEGGSEEDHDGPSWIRSGGSNTYTSGYTFATAGSMGSSTDYYQDGSATTGQVKLYHTSTAIFSSTPTSVKLTAKIGGGTGGTSLNTPVYAQLLNSSGTAIGNATEITSYITTNTGDTYTDVELDLTGITSAYGVMVYHAKQTSYNVRYYSFSLTYTTGGSTTSYISVPNCCTALGSINGSFFWTTLFRLLRPDKSRTKALFSYLHYVKDRFCSFLSAKRGTISFIFQLRQEKGFQSIGPETCRV